MDYKEFAKRIKSKYPEYAEIDDIELSQKIISKYPEYKDKVTFDFMEKGKTSLLKGNVEDLNKRMKYEANKALIDRANWEEKHPFISSIQKDYDPFYRSFVPGWELKSKYGLNAPLKAQMESDFKTAGLRAIPAINYGTMYATQGRFNPLVEGAIQGAVGGGLHEIGDKGLSTNVVPATLGGGLGGGLVGGTLGLGGKAINSMGGLGKGIGNFYATKVANIKPETLEQVVRADSNALDMSTDDAQRLLMNTTEQLRKDYNDVLAEKGRAVGEATKNLTDINVRPSVIDLKKDVTDIFDSYQADNVNVARERLGDLETNLLSKIDNALTPKETLYNELAKEQPINFNTEKQNEAFDILSKATNKPVNWLKSQLNALGGNKAVQQRSEFIHNLLDKVDDKLDLAKTGDINDYKYYYNADLGYNGGGDTTAGYNLAEKAYNDIINNNFRKDVTTPLDKAIYNAEYDYKTLLRDVVDKAESGNIYDEALNKVGNITKNLPEDVQTSFFERLTNDLDNIYKKRATISPADVHAIRKGFAYDTDFDTPLSTDLKNPILKRLYGKFSERLEGLSPELTQANKEYSQVANFRKNEGLNRILKPGEFLDKASSALKNYNNTITKGNTTRNVQDLENYLVGEGKQPFLNKIRDVNATMDLRTNPATGKDQGGQASLASLTVEPVLRGIRFANRKGLPQIYERVKQSPFAQIPKNIVKPLLYASPRVLYGGISNTEDEY